MEPYEIVPRLIEALEDRIDVLLTEHGETELIVALEDAVVDIRYVYYTHGWAYEEDIAEVIVASKLVLGKIKELEENYREVPVDHGGLSIQDVPRRVVITSGKVEVKPFEAYIIITGATRDIQRVIDLMLTMYKIPGKKVSDNAHKYSKDYALQLWAIGAISTDLSGKLSQLVTRSVKGQIAISGSKETLTAVALRMKSTANVPSKSHSDGTRVFHADHIYRLKEVGAIPVSFEVVPYVKPVPTNPKEEDIIQLRAIAENGSVVLKGFPKHIGAIVRRMEKDYGISGKPYPGGRVFRGVYIRQLKAIRAIAESFEMTKTMLPPVRRPIPIGPGAIKRRAREMERPLPTMPKPITKKTKLSPPESSPPKGPTIAGPDGPDKCEHLEPYISNTGGFHEFRGVYKFNKKYDNLVKVKFGTSGVIQLFDRMIYVAGKAENTKVISRYLQSKFPKSTGPGVKLLSSSVEKIKAPGTSQMIILFLDIYIRPEGGHSNVLIFAKNAKVYRFEPHGKIASSYNWQGLDEELGRYIRTTFDREYVGTSWMPEWIGLQVKETRQKTYGVVTGSVFGKERRIEAKGFCAAWSMLYVMMVTLHQSGLQDAYRFLDGPPDSLARKIRGWMSYLVNYEDDRM